MNYYRINVRLDLEKRAEKQAADYLKAMGRQKNKFIVKALLSYIENENTDAKNLLESIREILRDELQSVSFVSAPPAPNTVDTELTEEQQSENDMNILDDLEMFG